MKDNVNEIYKVEQMAMLGYTEKEDYFASFKSAKKFFGDRIKEFRKSEHLAKKDDSELSCYQKKPIEITKNKDNFILEASIAQWYKCSYEYDEWDISLTFLRLIRINVNQ